MGTGDMLHGMLYGFGLRVGKLNSASRMFATMFGRPDQLAVIGQCHDHTMYVAQVPARRFYFEPQVNLDTQAMISQWYGFDTPMSGGDGYVFEVEALGAKILAFGDGTWDIEVNIPIRDLTIENKIVRNSVPWVLLPM